MNYKNNKTDSGSYVNGVYTTKNGFTGSGLNCPKGTRLYEMPEGIIQPFFNVPEDIGETEQFKPITQEVAPDVLPYYAISNYGRVLNMRSGLILKPNYRPNGYEYLCLSADNCKNGQKKYTTHRMLMMTFEPRSDMNQLQVNHINFNKADNYINKTMPDGTIQSNLEWVTNSENIIHSMSVTDNRFAKLSDNDVKDIRKLRSEGKTFDEIKVSLNLPVTISAIQSVCNNKNFYDPDYQPLSVNEVKKIRSGLSAKRLTGPALTDDRVLAIRKMAELGVTQQEICDIFNISRSTVSDITTGKTHKDLL
jgi:hypothetical protein